MRQLLREWLGLPVNSARRDAWRVTRLRQALTDPNVVAKQSICAWLYSVLACSTCKGRQARPKNTSSQGRMAQPNGLFVPRYATPKGPNGPADWPENWAAPRLYFRVYYPLAGRFFRIVSCEQVLPVLQELRAGVQQLLGKTPQAKWAFVMRRDG
eukprot:gene6795-2907_t